MRIFLSHASEHAGVAESIAAALSGEGHVVFVDRASLPPGEAYNAQIRTAIEEADLFIFLVSPQSVSEGRYTLTELDFAKEKWRNPSSHVLPVVVAPTDRTAIPPYLLAVTLLQPRGNVPAAVVAAVARLAAPRWVRVVRSWSVVLVVLAVVAAVLGTRWVLAQRQLGREVATWRATGDFERQSGNYAAAWDAYAQAASRAPDDVDVVSGQERVAMEWLERIRVTRGKETFTAIVEKLQPVLARCSLSKDSRRAADCIAHIGWGEFLRSREGAGGLDPIRQYRRALELDMENVYAHAMWGFELLRTRTSPAEGNEHFRRALSSGRERDYVRGLQIAALLWSHDPESEEDLIRVANDIRNRAERTPADFTNGPDAGVWRFWNVYYDRLLNGHRQPSFLAAISGRDHVATFTWLFPESVIPRDKRNHYMFMLAALQESAGERDAALANYRAVRDALPKSALAAGGSLPERTLAAIKRLSR